MTTQKSFKKRVEVTMTHNMIPAYAWVESPLQLLCTVEYAAASGIPLRIVPLAGARQLEATVRQVTALGLPTWVTIERPRRSPLLALFRQPRGHWIVGDAYSRFARLALALGRVRWLTIVDDGAITMSLVDVLGGSAPLERPDSSEPLIVRLVARSALRRLLSMAASARLEIFSFYPLDVPMLRPHQFAWLRERATRVDPHRARLAPHQLGVLDGSQLILGSASVVDGSQSAGDYLCWVEAQHRPAVYYPHRRETADLLERIGLIEGITISVPGLPIELVLAASRGLRIASQPSSALATLGIILQDRHCVVPATGAPTPRPVIGAASAMPATRAGSVVPATRDGRSLVSAGQLS